MTSALIALVVIDQLTKLAAQSFLPTQTNSGSFLGIYIAKFPLSSLLIACFALIVLLSDIVRKKQIGSGETLILAGGLSNIIDRLIRPGVIDWIPFFGLWFNLADIYITFGVILILILTLTITLRGRGQLLSRIVHNSPRSRKVMS